MKIKHILFPQVNTAKLIEEEIGKPAENEVMVQTAFSSISCGTERANITGVPAVSIYSKEDCEVIFPRYGGYSSSGIVIAKGEKVTSVEIGDRVAMSCSFHKSINVLDEENVVKIKDDRVSLESAALCYIGTFSIAAVRKTKLELGESAMIMGLGILGLLAIQFAKAAGATPVIAVDPVKERREKALELGADYAFNPFDKDFIEKVKQVTDGGVNTAIEVTGFGSGLNQCLDCMKKFGRIALLGCTRDKDFTVDYYRKVHGPGIQLIGAHTHARPKYESHSGYFTQRDDIEAILKLCAMGRITLDGMVDEVYKPEECENVYMRLINDKNYPAVTQFDWRD